MPAKKFDLKSYVVLGQALIEITPFVPIITREWLARRLALTIGQAGQVLHRLNLSGLITSGRRRGYNAFGRRHLRGGQRWYFRRGG